MAAAPALQLLTPAKRAAFLADVREMNAELREEVRGAPGGGGWTSRSTNGDDGLLYGRGHSNSVWGGGYRA